MISTFRTFALSALALPLVLFASSAQAGNACGKFDFSSGVDCKIEVSGGCKAQCTPIQFEAGCTGSCEADVTQTCTGSCETTCIAQCDPAHLDCVSGCHGECNQPCIDQCQVDHPGEDCVTQCKGSCDVHCTSACGVTPSDCLSHCKECCHGACSTQVNLDCDIGCFAKLEGGCTAQCDAPSGALFCNGQYIFASDIDGCIAELAAKGITVNVEARANVTCDLNGCNGDGSASSPLGCSAAPGQSSPFTLGGIVLAVAAIGVSASRRRTRRGGNDRR